MSNKCEDCGKHEDRLVRDKQIKRDNNKYINELAAENLRLEASEQGALEQVADMRVRAETAESDNVRLRKALDQIASGTEDKMPPFRSAPASVLIKIAEQAIKVDTEGKKG